MLYKAADIHNVLCQARDLMSIYVKLIQVLYPRRSSGREVLK